MTGNVCPKCGKAVMTYSRFLREAEPSKISKCGNCGAGLRRSKAVYLLLLVMSIALLVAALGVFLMFNSQVISMAAMVVMGIVIFLGGVLLTNYLGFLFVGWRSSEDS